MNQSPLRKKNKVLVIRILKSICKKPSLSINHRDPPPRDLITMNLPVRKVTADVNRSQPRRVDVNTEPPFLTLEKLIPQLLKRQSPRGQEHERYLRFRGQSGRCSEYVSDHNSSRDFLVSVFPDVNVKPSGESSLAASGG